jgi:hypothetical protein
MKRLAGRKVFTVGKREYRWEDVVLAGRLWGDLAALERRTREGIACLKHLEKLGREPLEVEADEAADAWRYERDLLSADEMQSWLDERGLDMEEWLEYMLRSVSKAQWADELKDIAKAYSVSSKEVDALIYGEAVCSGALAELAERLAGQAAVSDRVTSETKGSRPVPSKAELRAVVKGLPSTVRSKGILGLDPKTTLERAEHVAYVTLSYERFIDRIAAPAALAREIEAHALDWTRLDCETVRFESEETAREAALLVREDGLALGQAAKMAKAEVEETHYVLEDLGPPLKDRLIGALPGQLIGPLSGDDGFLLVSIVDRQEASNKDRPSRERARDRVIKRTIKREIEKRVRWRERF